MIRRIHLTLILFMTVLVASLSLNTVAAAGYQLTVKTDKPTYARGAYVGISGNLTLNGSPVSNTLVGVEVRGTAPPYNLLFLQTPETDSNGFYSTAYQVTPSAPYGNNYTIYVAYADIRAITHYEVAASPPPDTIPPIISNVATSNIKAANTTITWVTNEPANSQVEYGASTSYGSTTPLSGTLELSHSVNLSGLSPSTTYHFKVKSADGSNNQAQSQDYTFTTTATPAHLTLTLNIPAQTLNITAGNNKVVISAAAGTSNGSAPGQVRYTWRCTGGTLNVTLNTPTDSRTVEWTLPSSNGGYQVTVTATADGYTSAETSGTVTVVPEFQGSTVGIIIVSLMSAVMIVNRKCRR